MTVRELCMEIKKGDVINGEYSVTKISSSFAICGDCRFALINSKKGTDKILTVHRNGLQYYTAIKHGGHRYGVKGGAYHPEPKDPNRACNYCGKVIINTLRISYCDDDCYRKYRREVDRKRYKEG
jgi:hypothetical protein